MSEAFLRVLNAHSDDTEALSRLWDDFSFSNADDSDDSDADSDSATATVVGVDDSEPAVTDSAPGFEIGETDDEHFDMLRGNIDAALEQVDALPEYVLPEEEDLEKATAFRFVTYAVTRAGGRCTKNNSITDLLRLLNSLP